MSQSPKNDPVVAFLTALFRALGSFIKSFFIGFTRLKRLPVLIGFVLTAAVTLLTYRNRDSILTPPERILTDEYGTPTYINSLDELMSSLPVQARLIIYWFLLLLPVFYLAIAGSKGDAKAKKYYKIFEEIGFKGKNGKYPYFLGQEKDGYKQILSFRSNIPPSEWKKAAERLETALDCSVRRITQHEKSKKTVKLVTVSTDYQIPKMVRWKDEYINPADGVLIIGQGDLDIISFDLNRTPHVLAAGETGSGKSVILRCMLWQMVMKSCRLYMIDFKGGVEFGKAYEQFGEVITERDRALVVLEMLVRENEQRLNLFRDLEVKNLKEYNDKTNSNLCRIGVFCDEIAEMLDKKGVAKSERDIYDKLEGALSTLARLSRATGINLFLGVQRPDANVLTGQIKNNVPVRISGHFPDKPASEIVLGNTAAFDLPDIKGRFIYKVGNELIEFQGFYFDDDKDLRDIEELDIEPGELLTDGGKTQSQTQSEKKQMSETKLPEEKPKLKKRTQKRQEKPQPTKEPPEESDELTDSDSDESADGEMDFDFLEE